MKSPQTEVVHIVEIANPRNRGTQAFPNSLNHLEPLHQVPIGFGLDLTF